MVGDVTATDEMRRLLTEDGILWADVASSCRRTLWRPGMYKGQCFVGECEYHRRMRELGIGAG